jgi:hypothetical protein
MSEKQMKDAERRYELVRMEALDQVESEQKRLIRKRRVQSLWGLFWLLVLGSLLYMLVGLEMQFMAPAKSIGISGVIIFFVILILMRAHKLLHMLVVLAVLVFIAAIIIVISGGIFFHIWSASR